MVVPPGHMLHGGRPGVPGIVGALVQQNAAGGWGMGGGSIQSPSAGGGWTLHTTPHGGVSSAPMSARMDEKPLEMFVCVTIPSGISEEVDSLERQARQARQEAKEQRHKSTQDYISRRAAEFRVALAELEVQMAGEQYKAIQGKILELQHEKLSS